MQNTAKQKKTRREKGSHALGVLRGARITEKGAALSAHNAYVFDVAPGANKKEIASAVAQQFKVVPRAVRIVITPPSRAYTRGTNRWGKTARSKKAYVYLKKGETIEIS